MNNPAYQYMRAVRLNDRGGMEETKEGDAAMVRAYIAQYPDWNFRVGVVMGMRYEHAEVRREGGQVTLHDRHGNVYV